MADIISCFPDPILCYILSFLPTKKVVATSVLSKRWNLLWRSVPSIDFVLQKNADLYNSFLCGRDMDQSLHRFRFRCHYFLKYGYIDICIEDVLRRSDRLEHFELKVGIFTKVPSVVFSCRTLVVLKLYHVGLTNISFVDLPLLKILHLYYLTLFHCEDLLQLFLSVCHNLEVLEVKTSGFRTQKFHSLPKLVRAKIDTVVVPFEIVKKVKVLVTHLIYVQDLVFDLQNLVQLDFYTWNNVLFHVLEVLRHCPKLQTLVIRIDGDEEEPVLPYPLTVPPCISLHLKSCCLKYYRESAFEFQFAEYIMLNANYLLNMKFCIHEDEYDNILRRHYMIRYLSSCSKSSDTCILSFEKKRNVGI